MTQLATRTGVSDTYPLPSNLTLKTALGLMYDVLNESTQAAELDLASAATTDIGNQLSRKLRITGTVGITSFGTTYTGPIILRINAALTITHNATSLICPGAANLSLSAGDILLVSPKCTTSGTFDGWIIIDVHGGGSGAYIAAATNKATPVGADAVGLWDSVTGLLNKLTLTNLAAYLATLCSAGWNAFTATTALNLSGTPAFFAPITNSLAGNVALNNTLLFFDGPSVAQGVVGKWFASGTVDVFGILGDAIYGKLWDGTTEIASCETIIANGSNPYATVSLSGFLASPAGNLRISIRNATSNTGTIQIPGIGAKNNTITAFRIG